MAQKSWVLSNVDILDEIFQWFDYELTHGHPLVDLVSFIGYTPPPDVEAVRRRSLASAARVCKAFHDPAIRVLWRQLESLLPLFSLIGSSFAKVQENVKQPNGQPFCDIYHLPDRLSAHEWARLTKYAAYVQVLYISSVLGPQSLTQESWESMKVLFGNRSVCPNLRMLKWGARWPETELPGILHFLTPTIDKMLVVVYTIPLRTSFDLVPTWQAVIPGIVEEICKRARRLSHLTVSTGHLNASELLTVLSHSHPPTFRGLHLQGQHGTPPISLSSFMDLAHITALESLQLNVPVECGPEASLPAVLNLPHLRHLRLIHAYHKSHPAYSIITSSRLQLLHVNHMEYSSFASLHYTCAAWEHSFPNLEVLAVRLRPSTLLMGIQTRSLLTAVRPLLNFRKMRSCTIGSSYAPFTIDDADLEALSVAWPSLTKLDISSMSTWAGMPGLLSLATNCPNLTALSIRSIVIRSEDIPGDVLQMVPMNHPLKTLVVVYGLPADTYHLIRDKLFPNINLRPGLYGFEEENSLYYA
ncbi:hypothetical protein GY45DRAFT_1326547 [Cubamyces sp. BRFM 1775]|nr:hypothetical protein GY45DRAFT_1326547 [Cubamyces sp. BRFM 1775]